MMQMSTDVSLSITKGLLGGEGKNSNVVCSPLSIQVLLSLIAAGSSGPTLNELLTFLKSKSVDELNDSVSRVASFIFADGSHCRLSFACGAWVDQSHSVNPSFKHLLHTSYKATLQQPNFRTKADEVVREVNSWVEKHTNGLITNILSPGSISRYTDIILANALYFKGDWIQKFDSSKTKPQKFYLLDGSSVEVPFMISKEKQFIAAYDGFKVLEMPYQYGSDKGRRFSMCIFLPDATDGLPSLIENLSSEFIGRHLPRKQVNVGEFKIPKFKFSFEDELSGMLKKMGLVSPFTATEGNFSEMVDSNSMKNDFVSQILHKACIEVDEKGTEAAAVTILIAARGCGLKMRPKLEVIDFVADHPFLFAIREDTTGTLPFVGQLLNPFKAF